MDKTENIKIKEEGSSDVPSQSGDASVGVKTDGTNGNSVRKRAASGDVVDSSASDCKRANTSLILAKQEQEGKELKETSDIEADAVCSSSNTQEPGARPQSDWWSPELTALRQACVAARRKYTRHRRLRIRPPDTVEREAKLYEGYKVAKLALKAAIVKAKELAHGKREEKLRAVPPSTE